MMENVVCTKNVVLAVDFDFDLDVLSEIDIK